MTHEFSGRPFDLQDLLVHREWVSRVARSLVHGDAEAEDLEQRAWVRILERPPAEKPRSVRAWLRGVLRFTALDGMRKASARRRHEKASAVPERVDETPVSNVARIETFDRLVHAVLELQEPYREAIILRYFEDLKPGEIARRQGIPVETVRTRTKRAIALLRARLDSEGGGDGTAWHLALIPLIRGPEMAAPTGPGMGPAVAQGGILMATKGIAAAVAFLLVIGAGAAWKLQRTETPLAVRKAEVLSFSEAIPAALEPVANPGSKTTATAPAPIPDAASALAPVEDLPLPKGTRSATWPVVPGEVPVPPDGTVITLRPIPGARESESDLPCGTIVESELVVEGLPERFWGAFAVAPGGLVARLFLPEGTDRGLETSFRKSRRIAVIVKEESGAPAEGERIEVREEGNNPIAPPGVSNREGRIEFEGLHGGRASLHLLPSTLDSGRGVGIGAPVGTVDLEAGDAHLEVVLRPRVLLLARVTWSGSPHPLAGIEFRFENAVFKQRSDDENTATAQFILRPASKEPRIQVSASVDGRTVATTLATWSEKEKAFVADLQAQRKEVSTLSVRIKPPADGRFLWELRRLGGPKGVELIQGSAFRTFQSDSVKGPRDRPEFGGLKPGRYQFVTDCGLATEPVEFGEESSALELELDLSNVQMVTGRFEGPPGADLSLARVEIEGEGLAAAATGGGFTMGRGAASSAPFHVRVPGDRPVRLRASHPSLVASPSGGTFDVQGAAGGVVLVLVEGVHAIFQLDPPLPPDEAALGWRPTIHLFRGEPSREPASSRVAEGNVPYRFGGYSPGVWTVFVDAPGRAPGVLREVRLLDGHTDLGSIRLEDGASVRFKFRVADGAVPPSLLFQAIPLGGPMHLRSINYFGTGEPILRGLGKGPYRIAVYPSGGPMTALLDQRVESDGTGETVLELDLR